MEIMHRITKCVYIAAAHYNYTHIHAKAFAIAWLLCYNVQKKNRKGIVMEYKDSSVAPIIELLLGDCSVQSLEANRETILRFIPELKEAIGLKQHNPYHNKDVWEHTLIAVSKVPEDFNLRFAALLHDVGKPRTHSTDEQGIDHFYGHTQVSVQIAADVFARLELSRKDAKEILNLIALHDVDIEVGGRTWERLKREYNSDFLGKLLLLKRADVLAQHPDKLGTRLADLQTLRVDLVTL